MALEASLSPELSKAFERFKKSVADAILSLPPLPAGPDFTGDAKINIFEGSADVMVTDTPNAEKFLNILTAKFTAFAGAK